jgi:hypothetical protein
MSSRGKRGAIAAAALAAALCLGASAVSAQETAAAASAAPQASAAGEGGALSAFGRPRYMIFLFEAEEGTLSAQESFVLYNSILAAVAQANADVVILESPDVVVPRTKEGKEELARRIDADSWLHVVASGGFGNLTVEASTFDILKQETIGEHIVRPGFVVDFRVVARGLWDDISASIEGGYERIVDTSTLTVKGRPGTKLEGAPGGPYEIGAEGIVALELPYPSVFALKAKAPGAYDEARHVSLGIEAIELDLGQVMKPRFGVEASLSGLQFPAMRLWASIVRAKAFARLYLSTQMIGLYPLDNAASIVQTGSPLSLAGLDAGLYVLPPERLFRLFVAAGGYLRISHPAGFFGLDKDLAIGAATLSLGGEYSPSRRLRFVASYDPAYVFADDPGKFVERSFAANSYPSGEVPGYVFLENGLLDLRNFHIGVRLDF